MPQFTLNRKNLTSLTIPHLTDELSFSQSWLTQQTWQDQTAYNLEFDHCLLDHVHLGDTHLDKVMFRQVLIDSSNLSNGQWEKAHLSQVEMCSDKATGLKLNEAVLLNVHWLEVKADYAQLQSVKTKGLKFERCNLQRAYFNKASLQSAMFKDCDLTEADFSGAILTGTDLRGSILDSIKISPNQLRGVIVTADQALYLSSLMGLRIEP